MPEQMTLIMVGDTDQLPSVGAGNVLKDIISSGRIPVVRLSRIFRQARGSRIIMNAHRINKGEQIDMRGGRDSDFFFAAKETNEEVVELLVKYCTENLPRYYHVDALQDIQVLTPMQRGVCGAANLNQVLQEAMNPGSIFLRRGGTQYRLHDKVMQIRNDYDKEVFNGDIGVINHVDMEERELTVDFDGREVVYDVSELEELTLAYATTIHKSQGSEYPAVVIPLLGGIRVPHRGDAFYYEPLCDVAEKPALHRRDQGEEDPGADRGEKGGLVRRQKRDHRRQKYEAGGTSAGGQHGVPDRCAYGADRAGRTAI